MTKTTDQWKADCAAFWGNVLYNAANKELEKGCLEVLLALFTDAVLTVIIFIGMFPFEDFGELFLFYIILRCTWRAVSCLTGTLMHNLTTAVADKYESYARSYGRRKNEKKIDKIRKKAVRRAERHNRAELRRARREQAARAKAAREEAMRERAEREEATREQAARERAERESARRAGQVSAVRKARQLLRVKESYTESELKRARNALMKEFHPDNADGGNEELCKEINKAYELLRKYAKAA
ncbi:MAG: DnaJ domain-containing protein [Clostridium sp.]|nr:DnaJ domain-containing protein [Acetatifactor muris]MCM1527270.1 DnaJ domain-containing protein [Bacteroides sp.]MCM1563036.1 DnaJ domain-containing protein [Clostridium sp.]